MVPDSQPDCFISIHAPRVGSDSEWFAAASCKKYFNPRSPCGERPEGYGRGGQQAGDFNPRSPCGERPAEDDGAVSGEIFQSTLPVWGATVGKCQMVLHFTISIHAPRVGSDV